ncbi:MAG: FAD/NAD(P)-binding oxidoreductase, partial [Acetobacter sp.]|uniref:FAD-dependent oxidoreductase n=1 Tax=Acetobacter sp. TaxID=440 RepID=UPI0039ECE150
QTRQRGGAGDWLDRRSGAGEALCLLNAATGREQTMPHDVPPAQVKRGVVVVGAGVAGLEAARVCALRGHDVTLLEKADRTGGQVNIAAKAGWREALSGIVRWLDGQVRKLGVDVRLNTQADAAMVAALAPDVVVVATGGKANPGEWPGHDLACTARDVLEGKASPEGSVLLYDEMGQHNAASVAELLATRGCQVEMVTADRLIAQDVGTTNQPVHLRELYRLGVILSPNLELCELYREENRVVAVLRNTMTGEEEERLIDSVVVECGNLPLEAVYFDLKPNAVNHGVTDLPALLAGRPQPGLTEKQAGTYALFRIGDAVAGRNIHAAIYDALRLCKDF